MPRILNYRKQMFSKKRQQKLPILRSARGDFVLGVAAGAGRHASRHLHVDPQHFRDFGNKNGKNVCVSSPKTLRHPVGACPHGKRQSVFLSLPFPGYKGPCSLKGKSYEIPDCLAAEEPRQKTGSAGVAQPGGKSSREKPSRQKDRGANSSFRLVGFSAWKVVPSTTTLKPWKHHRSWIRRGFPGEACENDRQLHHTRAAVDLRKKWVRFSPGLFSDAFGRNKFSPWTGFRNRTGSRR
ncbi:hypothetical protein TGPRC2_321685 [Toxoplasma gondii TgCatPRC2]|uniref:Uncharacterized protein n=1 Tax=Toxoplasma gondii TgCatPRC2 TaxID=1130821 RepID=A0A151HH85_TOXGO|nr:hypothetical protein TGPRC2_321685 [Toxoplasma gondii TgCatPRC2]